MRFIKHKFTRFLKGFTLIELMVVVAIIGVLAMIAIPAYDGYMLRAKTTHISAMADEIKKGITEYRALNGSFPPNLAAAYKVVSDKYASISGANNSLNCALNSTLTFIVAGQNIFGGTAGPFVAYQGKYMPATSTSAGGIDWSCSYSIPAGITVPNTFLTECSLSATTIDANTATPTCV